MTTYMFQGPYAQSIISQAADLNQTIISHAGYLATALGLALIIALIIIWRLERRINKLLIGKNAHSFEDSITNVSNDLIDLKRFTTEMEQYLLSVETRLKKSIQSVETVRFNPFQGTGSGGNNSFSAAFLNEHGNGIVLTSMYARDRISMFAKPVKAFASTFELSEEEVTAIDQSKKTLAV